MAHKSLKMHKQWRRHLLKKDTSLISGGTDNHLMLLDLSNKGVTGKLAENALVKADITINKNMVPFDTKSPFVTSGIRVGTAAITTRGFDEADCVKVVDWIDMVLSDAENEGLIADTKRQVNTFMQNFPMYQAEGDFMRMDSLV